MKTTSVSPGDFLDLATFHHPSAAKALKSCLEFQGLPVRLKDERKLQRFWFMAPPEAGIHVQVERKNFEIAQIILSERQLHGAQAAVQCPSCGSVRVQFPALTRKNILPGLVGWLLAVLHVTEHKYYCEDCHFTWPRHQSRPRPRDILGW